MRGIGRLSLATLVFCGVFAPSAHAAEEDWRVQRLNARYEDFFARRKRAQEYDERREAGAGEVKTERQKWDQEMKKAREHFIATRPPPPNLDAAYLEWAKQKEKESQEHNQARKQYVDVQNRIEKLEESAKKIPEDLEYNLDNEY